MYNILDACNNLGTLGTILFIKNLIKIICVATPVLLLLMMTIDFVKAGIASDEKAMDKAKKLAIKRVVYAVAVFLVPYIVNGSMALLGDSTKISTCYDKADTTTVQNLSKLAELEQEKKQAETEAAKEKIQKQINKINKDMQKKRKKAIKSNNSSSSGSYANVSSNYTHATKIAHAAVLGPGCSEANNASNCTPGDQGGEVDFGGYHAKDWAYVFRIPDATAANKAANCMVAAVKNDNIGYGRFGSSPWLGLASYLNDHKKLNWDPGKVKKKVSVSCCPLVGVCLKAAGYKFPRLSYTGLGCDGAPENKANSIRELGNYKDNKKFILIYSHNPNSSKNNNKFKSKTNIMRGDILIHARYNHMAMAV